MGIPTFESANGEMMEAGEGASIAELRIQGNNRQSVFRSYTYPRMHQPNLTVLTAAHVTRVVLDGSKAVAVEAIVDDKLVRFEAGRGNRSLPRGGSHAEGADAVGDPGLRPNCVDMAFRSSKTCLASAKTIRITSHLADVGIRKTAAGRRRWM